MNEEERLRREIAVFQMVGWLIKDRATVQECLESIDRAVAARRAKLEELEGGSHASSAR